MATLIVDGHYTLHRMLKQPNLRLLSTTTGKPAGATFGAIRTLRTTLWKYPEIQRVVFVFDAAHSKRRLSLYPQYKQRTPDLTVDPDGLTYQQKFNMNLNYLRFALPKLGIKVVRLDGREGDDTIAMLCRELKDPLKIVMSDDKDMFQLVREDVHIWRPIAEQRISLSDFEEIVGHPFRETLLRKAILGDGSDNIPGVEGVGPKTLDKIFELYGDEPLEYPFEEFFDTVSIFGGSRAEKILSAIGQILLNYELVDMSKEVFFRDEIDRALALVNEVNDFNVPAVKRLFVSLEFYSLIEDFSSWVTRFQVLR